MTQFSDDLTNVAIAGLKSSDEVMHRYSADLIESLKQENAALREQVKEYGHLLFENVIAPNCPTCSNQMSNHCDNGIICMAKLKNAEFVRFDILKRDKQIQELQSLNVELKEQNRKLELFNQDIVESSKKVQYLNARLVKLLKRLEWQEFGFCPDCENDEDDGHANNCELGNLLAEVRSKK